MDDLTMLRELGEETALPTREALAPARARLLAATAAERSTALPSGRGRRRSFRFASVFATAGVAAAAIVATVIVTYPAPSPAPAPPVAQGSQEPKLLLAAQVLEKAATAALKEPDVIPRADQFLYQRTVDGQGRTHHSWYSVDGTHDGLVYWDGEYVPNPGCRNGRRDIYKGTYKVDGTESCTPEPTFLPDLPTDPDALMKVLEERASVKQYPGRAHRTQLLAEQVSGLGHTYWLRPAQKAALYRVAARIDGVSVVENVANATGRKGTGIRWTYRGTKERTIIFDPVTYEFLGSPERVSTLVVVDKVGERG